MSPLSPWTSLGIGIPNLPPGRPGDPGLFGPGTPVWTIGRERVLLAAGPAALLLQVAHPLVAAGVAAHSDFRRDPLGRLRSTLEATLRISFGDAEQSAAAAASVRRRHGAVHGGIEQAVGPFPAGTTYDATDPELALWVHATLVWAALTAYGRFVRVLRPGEADGYYEALRPFAGLFGVTDRHLPPTYADFRTYWRSMLEGPSLAVGDEGRALARDILDPPSAPAAGVFTGVFRAVTSSLLPARIRAAFGLPWRPRDRATAAAASLALRAGVRVLPPSARYWPHERVARRRMGI